MEKSKGSYGIGITGIATAVLIALKLAGIIECSWLFTLAPLFFGVVLKVAILLLVMLYYKILGWRC